MPGPGSGPDLSKTFNKMGNSYNTINNKKNFFNKKICQILLREPHAMLLQVLHQSKGMDQEQELHWTGRPGHGLPLSEPLDPV